jgi:predicted GNAT superfamily acetyltransferase
LAQRQALLDQGLTDWVTWTYDPLFRANAVFNIHRLGATCNTYVRNVYGELRDSLNAGVPSDRCQVDWRLNSPHVLHDIEPQRHAPSWEMANMVLPPVQSAPSGFLQPVDHALTLDGHPIAIPIPDDIGAIRRADSDLSMAWRYYLRSVLEPAFAAGYSMVDCIHVPSHGWRYVLVREYP